MKTGIKYFIFAFCFSSFMSCSEDFLEKLPQDQIVSTNFYKTEEDARRALVSIYDALGYQSTPGVAWAPLITISDILSDDSFAGGADANDGLDEDELNRFDIPTTNVNVHAIWIKNYEGIYRSNLLLERLPEIEASDDFKARIIAECKFLRAYFYFEQVRYFENIPLLINTIAGPSEYSQTQNTPEEVYNQIAADLMDAINGLPAELPAVERGRISKWAAKGLLGRVYLFYNGVYSQDLNADGQAITRSVVAAELDDLIQNSGHDLLENYDELFRLSGEYGPESVFEIAHGDSPVWWDWGYVRGGEGNLASQMQGPRVTGSGNWDRGWSFGTVSQDLVNVLNGDPRQDAIILFEEELDGSLDKGYQHTGYFSQKYSSDSEHWGTSGQFELNRTTNNRVIRFADVLLMAAELGSPNAQAHFDRVRARVGLESIPLTEESLRLERRKELALEGIRYFDLIRYGLQTADEALTSIGERGPNYEGDQIIFDVEFNIESKGFLPIPQTEIDLSAGIFKQNAGY